MSEASFPSAMVFGHDRHSYSLGARFTGQDSCRPPGNNEVPGRSQGVREVAGDNA